MSSFTEKYQKEKENRKQNPYKELSNRDSEESIQLVKSDQGYRAVIKFKPSEKSDRFRIIDALGNIDLYQYNHLLESSYRDGMLSLITTTRSFILSGRNLDRVIDLLADQKVKALCAFNTASNEPTEDSNAIFIEGIARE